MAWNLAASAVSGSAPPAGPEWRRKALPLDAALPPPLVDRLMHFVAYRLGLIVALIPVSLAVTSCSSSSDGGTGSGSGSGTASQTSFPAPNRKGGETWTIRTVPPKLPAGVEKPTMGPDPEKPYDTVYVVDFAGERGGWVGRALNPDGKAYQLTYNVDGLLVTLDTCSFAPAFNTVMFPLEVGRKWNVDSTGTCGTTKTHYTGTGEVVGRESVPIAAFGPVDALKIVVKTSSVTPAVPAGSGPDSTTNGTSTFYWAPRFGTYVKEIYEYPREDGMTTSTAELASFTAAK